MSPNPTSLLAHLREYAYHSRSDKHSNALGEAIAADLIKHCPRIREKAEAGEVVYDLNFTISSGTSDWNVDLVLGAPGLGEKGERLPGTPILKQTPSTVEIAIEFKAVMTAHRKAVKNRKRDLESHHEHVHNYNNRAIAGGVFIINGSEKFQSPLRTEITEHKNVRRTLEHCLNELRAVTNRRASSGTGIEAKCAILVDMDNVNLAGTQYYTAPPAPQVGDPLHYDAFIQTLCQRYTERF